MHFSLQARVREAEIQTKLCKNPGSNENPAKRARAFLRMQQALIAAQELGDEKMGLLQAIQEKIENKTRLLDQDHKNLGTFQNILASILLKKLVSFITIIKISVISDFGKEEQSSDNKEQQPPVNNTTSNASLVNNERPSKRARRTRNDTFSGLEANHNDGNAAEHTLRSQAANNSTTSSTQKKTTNGK